MRGNLGRAPPELTFFDMRAVVLMSSVFDLVRYSEFPDARHRMPRHQSTFRR